ncbi:MAG: hypothetical protein H7Z43_09820 [Clostridia bacterium]|nr:hypothetical protein [Deltaproteobacteria bacterium]
MIRYSVFVGLVLAASPVMGTRVLGIGLPDLVKRAELVADVEVLKDSSSSFWVDGRIFTRRTALVRATWKGFSSVKTVNIVTRGGVVGRIGQRVDGEAVLDEGARGVAFLIYVPSLDGYRVVALAQGFVPLGDGDTALAHELEVSVRSYGR